MSRRRYIGFRQLDIMETLLSNRMTVKTISEELGLDRSNAEDCLKRLRDASLVRSAGRSKLSKRSRLWQLSASGKRALAEELARGATPGVATRRRRAPRTKRAR